MSRRRKQSHKTDTAAVVVADAGVAVHRPELVGSGNVSDMPSSPSPGVRLRRAREERNLSLEGVAARLKLDVSTITALERDELTQLGAPVFALGYLRAYARLVELPADELIADFGDPEGLLVPSIDPTGSPACANLGQMQASPLGGGLWKRVVVTVVVIALVAVATALWDRSNKPVPVPFVITPAPVPVPQEFTDEAPPTMQRNERVIDEPVAGSVGEAQDGEVIDKLIDEVTNVLPEPVADEAAPVETLVETTEPRAQLVLFFNQDSWVEVHDARGEQLLFHLGRAGVLRSVTGVAPFEVRLGYAPGVDVTYNGEPFDMTRYAARSIVRFQVGRAGDMNEAGNDVENNDDT